MGFEEEAIQLAAEAREREQRRQAAENAAAASVSDIIGGFIRILQKNGYRPVPVFEQTTHRVTFFDRLVQYHQPAGLGWCLSVTGDGGMSSLVIAADGRTAGSGSLISSRSNLFPSDTAYRGLPRVYPYIQCWPLSASRSLYHDEESAIRIAAAEILNGTAQRSAGRAN